MENPYIEPGFYCADCMEAMKHFPDHFFDLAVVDPPYGINVTGRHKSPVLVGGGCKAVWRAFPVYSLQERQNHNVRKQILQTL